MKVRVCYTIDVDDEYRRAISNHYGLKHLATRKEIVAWCKANGDSGDNDLTADLERADADEEDVA